MYEGRSRMKQKEVEPYRVNNCRWKMAGHSIYNKTSDSLLDFEPPDTDNSP